MASRPSWRTLAGAAFVAAQALALGAQFQMPDPRQMSGIPRPVTDLPARSVSVRLIRGDLSNNIANFPVELQVNGKAQTVKTDEAGRAQFDGLPPGATLKAVAIVDGERLESQEFPAPAQGGIRLLLVATDKEKEAQRDAGARAPAVQGAVVIGGESRVVIEPDEEAVRVYYLLEVANTARTPVNPPTLFMFDTPKGALGTTIIEGSSPQATATGTRVRVQGPFAPGNTFVQVAFELPALTGSASVLQTFPAPFEHLAVIVKKAGDTKLSSPQIARQQDMPAGDAIFIAAAGDKPIPAGEAVTLNITGLPHHSDAPRWVALSLAIGIVVVGLLAAGPSDPKSRGEERRQLIARREKLFQDLLRLEVDHRRGRGDQSRYAGRRQELVAAHEHLYGALDTDDTSPEPANRTGGLAA
jgi:hypothetical protein